MASKFCQVWLCSFDLKPPYLSVHYFTLSTLSNVQRLRCISDLPPSLSPCVSCVLMASLLLSPMSPMCGVGAAHCVSAGSRRRAGTQNGRQCEHLPSARPTQSHHSHNLQVTQTFKLESPNPSIVTFIKFWEEQSWFWSHCECVCERRWLWPGSIIIGLNMTQIALMSCFFMTTR